MTLEPITVAVDEPIRNLTAMDGEFRRVRAAPNQDRRSYSSQSECACTLLTNLESTHVESSPESAKDFAAPKGWRMLQPKVSLLLVDDDVILRQTLFATFVALGYRVRTAADGFGALDSMREELPDILLSDLQMPGMSGFELLYVVKRRFPAVRVVAMSGAYSGEQVPEGVAADAFHAKGSSSRALLQTINAMAESSRDSLQQTAVIPDLIWIAGNFHDCSGQSYVLIACPDCLRTFPELLNVENAIHESTCVYCGVSLQYAIVQVSSPTLPAPAKPQLPTYDTEGLTLDFERSYRLST